MILNPNSPTWIASMFADSPTLCDHYDDEMMCSLNLNHDGPHQAMDCMAIVLHEWEDF